ncbi:hypothetical protein [Mesorhizobium sp. CN2-181]|uniref:hypothetical protein n=1 Tax=Mesorhizobium yinganensis TaxID=3157707 RepID=UPI0032B7046A
MSKIQTFRPAEKIYKIGDVECPVRASDAPPNFVDLVIENRHCNGNVYLSLASLAIDGTNVPEVQIVSRLRMSLVIAQHMRDLLTEVIDLALKPVDKKHAN